MACPVFEDASMSVLKRVLLFAGTFVLGCLVEQTVAVAIRSPKGANRDVITSSAFASKAAQQAGHEPDIPERLGSILTAIQDLHGGQVLRGRAELYEAISSLTTDQLIAMLDRSEGMPPRFKTWLGTVILDRLFQLDPAKADTWLKAHFNDHQYWWAWAEHAPESALREFLEKNAAQGFPGFFTHALECMNGKTPEEKIAFLEKMPPGVNRNACLCDIITTWAGSDPYAALDALSALPKGRARSDLENDVLRKCIAKDAGLAMRRAELLFQSTNDTMAIMTVADGVASRDPQAAFDWITTLPDELRPNAQQVAIRHWAKTDPISALDWCIDNGVDVTSRVRYVEGSILKSAIMEQPAQTIDWINSLEEGPDRDQLAERALQERLDRIAPAKLLSDSSDAIFSLYAELPESAKPRAANAIGQKMGWRYNFEDFNRWASQLTSNPERQAAIIGLTAVLGIQSGGEEKFLKDLDSFSSTQDRDAALIGFSQGERGPDALMYALQISDPIQRQDALDTAVDRWLQSQPDTCKAWIHDHASQLPAASMTDWLARK